MTNLMPVETFRRHIGYHPWHFWGLADLTIVPVTSACNDFVTEYGWQNQEAAGRDDVRQAIETAEAMLFKELNFWPVPKFSEFTLRWPLYVDKGVWRVSHANAVGKWLDVKLSESYLQKLGIETRTAIGDAAVVYTDDDGDGLDETFTVTIATSVTDTDQIAIYFLEADRPHSEAVSERWRIQPVTVSISGGNATIKGRSWLLVKPGGYEGAAAGDNALDPTDATKRVTQVSVYRYYTDQTGITNSTSQALLVWETLPYPSWAVCCYEGSATFVDSRTDPAALASSMARGVVRNSEGGVAGIGHAIYDADEDLWSSVSWGLSRPPDRVTVRYRAGYPLTDGEMSHDLQIAITRLAAAELNRKICACDQANRELHRWQFDLSLEATTEEKYGISAVDLENPFGTRRGHVYAWRFCTRKKQLEGFVF
jgi:hypothetical protein